MRTYTELSKLKTFKERFEYLRLDNSVGKDTFGNFRYLNQNFYKSKEWKQIRDEVIIRDNACDLGLEGYEIDKGIIIHHINPILRFNILEHSDLLINPEYLITVSHKTHNAIHYGTVETLPEVPNIRLPNDTCLWRIASDERKYIDIN